MTKTGERSAEMKWINENGYFGFVYNKTLAEIVGIASAVILVIWILWCWKKH